MKLLNEILGTRYPIIQGGMANIATGEFAAACSNGGALGVIACGGLQSGNLPLRRSAIFAERFFHRTYVPMKKNLSGLFQRDFIRNFLFFFKYISIFLVFRFFQT